MDWKTDNRGRLALAGIHDSNISLLVANSREKTIILEITSGSGKKISITGTDTHVSNISSLWESSIVSDVYIWKHHFVPNDYLLNEDAGWRHLLLGRVEEQEEIVKQVSRYEKQIQEAYLTSIVCSYGGGVSFLSNRIEILEA